jgi:hypothetical protein
MRAGQREATAVMTNSQSVKCNASEVLRISEPVDYVECLLAVVHRRECPRLAKDA